MTCYFSGDENILKLIRVTTFVNVPKVIETVHFQ